MTTLTERIPIFMEAVPRAPVPFHLLIKPIGPACNLACRYCYYPQGETPVEKMSDAALSQFIRHYIAAQPRYTKEINFVWQGGEPLLAGIGFYKKALRLQQQFAPPGVTISNSLQTNGTLLTPAWCQLFREHQFTIGVSLDGGQAVQDVHRPDKHGEGSYAYVERGLTLLNTYQVPYNLLVVVHDEVAHRGAEIYDHLVSLGACFLQFQPLMSEGKAAQAGYGLSAEHWGQFLLSVYRRWQSQQHLGRVFIMNVEHAIAQYFTQVSPTCVHAARCGSNLVMEPDGTVYACDHLMDEQHQLGVFQSGANMAEWVARAVEMPFAKQKSQRRECRSCSVQRVCQGGCPAHSNAQGQNRLCSGYYHFFSAVLAPLRHYPPTMAGLAEWRKTLFRQ